LLMAAFLQPFTQRTVGTGTPPHTHATLIPVSERSVNKMAELNRNLATLAIHAGQEPSQWHSHALIPPISLSTTFAQSAPAELFGFDYSRSGNPTRSVFERCVAAVEGAKHGFAFSSGLASTTTLLHSLKEGEEVLCMDDVYGGTNRLMNKVFAPNGVKIRMVDCSNPDNLAAAMNDKVKIVWVETPTNPTLKLVDIAACVKIVRGYKDVVFVADNTFMSPCFQRPLDLGADISMHSVSKYINGHSDVIMGLLLTNDDALAEKLAFLQNSLGAVPSPFDCYLANRGLKTLPLRMERHAQNALQVARFLEGHAQVEKVRYPGLESHPQHQLFKRQCTGGSGMVTFWLKGDLESAKRFIAACRVFTLAESLGGFESLIELPSLMTHASVPADQRRLLDISDSLIRLSVGLECVEDLLEDIKGAFAACL
jgi:cystathionine gamma-lyase